MNKRNIIKTILILTSIIFILYFLTQTENLGFLFLIPLLFLTTLYMYKYKDKIIKHKFIYDVILMLLIFFCFLLLLCVIIMLPNIIKNIISVLPIILVLLILYLMFKIFIDSILTLKFNNDKINDYIIIIAFSVINLVFIRYYFDINYALLNTIDKIEFINQNYIYFFIVLLVIEIHKLFSNKLR